MATATNLRAIAHVGVVIFVLASAPGCAPPVRFEPASPAWEARPARACPRVRSLGEVDLGGGRIVAAGCTPERPCLLVEDRQASSVQYLELSLPGPRIEHSRPIVAPSGRFRGVDAAALTGQEIVIVSGGMARISLHRFTTSGEHPWQAELPLRESHGKQIQVIGDHVALLFQHDEGPRLALFGRGDGELRRTIDLGAPAVHWASGCLTQVDGRLFTAWLGDLTLAQSYAARTTVESAWITPATGEVRRGERQTAKQIGHQLVCAPHGHEVGVAILGESGRLHFTRIAPDGTTRPLHTVTTMRSGGHHHGQPQLLTSDDGFMAAWSAYWIGHDDRPPREYVTFLDLDGHRTRIVELGKHTGPHLLFAGPRGPMSLYRSSWSSSRPWSAAAWSCDR